MGLIATVMESLVKTSLVPLKTEGEMMMETMNQEVTMKTQDQKTMSREARTVNRTMVIRTTL